MAVKKPKRKLDNTKRNFTKYSFADNSKLYGKGPFVHAILYDFCKRHAWVDYQILQKVFPGRLIGRYGVFTELGNAKKVNIAFSGNEKYSTSKPIKLKDKKIAVCNQITIDNIQPFLARAKDLGYKIKTWKAS